MLILLLGIGIVIIAFTASSHLFDEVGQLLNREYASSISVELEPFVKDGFSEDNVHDAIHYMMVLNPLVEIYLLDSKGKILAYFAGKGNKVVRNSIDLIPVKDFITESKDLPILGDDPRSNKNKKPFSVSTLQMGDDNGYVYVILRGESYDKSLSNLSSSYYLTTGITTLLLAIIITLFLGLFLFFILTKRLRTLNKAVTEFKNGNYEQRINITGSDELSFLGETFNQMAESIKLSEKQKNDLIANISHDLRSPLTSIRGHLETVILKDEKLDSIQRQKYLNITLKNLHSFQSLVDRLFELAKLENNQIVPRMESFCLAELAQDVVMKLKPSALAKNMKLLMDQPFIGTNIVGDIAMIERVLSNIIENSIKYSFKEKDINIKFSRDSKYINIIIIDKGFGISNEDLPYIFERFYRGDRDRSSDITGSGLGLAIVKEIITLHKGTIDVKSHINVGTTFNLSFPNQNLE